MINATFEQVDNMYRHNPRFRKTILNPDSVYEPVREGVDCHCKKDYICIHAKNDRFELFVNTDFLDERYDYNYVILDGVRHSFNDFDSWEQVEAEIVKRL